MSRTFMVPAIISLAIGCQPSWQDRWGEWRPHPVTVLDADAGYGGMEASAEWWQAQGFALDLAYHPVAGAPRHLSSSEIETLRDLTPEGDGIWIFVGDTVDMNGRNVIGWAFPGQCRSILAVRRSAMLNPNALRWPSHEIGHAFGLKHVHGPANVMWPSSNAPPLEPLEDWQAEAVDLRLDTQDDLCDL